MDKNGKVDASTPCESCGRSSSHVVNGIPLCDDCIKEYDGNEKLASMEPSDN